MASEFNIMTAFLVSRTSSSEDQVLVNENNENSTLLDNKHYEIRTFTPTVEVCINGILDLDLRASCHYTFYAFKNDILISIILCLASL